MPTSNSSYGTFSSPGEVRFVRHLPGSIERAWSYLAESEKRARWLAPGVIELRVGGRVELNFHHADLSTIAEVIPEKYQAMCAGNPTIIGRVTRCEPPRLLSYTWGFEADPVSEVTFELLQAHDSVQLVLTHRRLGDDPAIIASVAAGWHTHVAILIAHLENAGPVPFWETHSRLERDYTEQLAGR